MAKTKIDDLAKGTEEMDAKEQKAAKGGAVIVEAATLKASQTSAALAQSALATPTLASRDLATATTMEPLSADKIAPRIRR